MPDNPKQSIVIQARRPNSQRINAQRVVAVTVPRHHYRPLGILEKIAKKAYATAIGRSSFNSFAALRQKIFSRSSFVTFSPSTSAIALGLSEVSGGASEP